MPTIKMKKGYPTSDGVMHDKHADAVARQAQIEFRATMELVGIDIDAMEKLSDDQADVLRDWLKYTRPNVTTKVAAPKKKTAAKKPAASADK